MAAAGGPTILLGDFNLTDQNDSYALLRDAGLTDAFRTAGWGFGATWPVRKLGMPFPLVRIDYIWYSERIHCTQAWLGPDLGSDHLPLLADLTWSGDVDE